MTQARLQPSTLAKTLDKDASSAQALANALAKTEKLLLASANRYPTRTPGYPSFTPRETSPRPPNPQGVSVQSQLGSNLVQKRKLRGLVDRDALLIAAVAESAPPPQANRAAGPPATGRERDRMPQGERLAPVRALRENAQVQRRNQYMATDRAGSRDARESAGQSVEASKNRYSPSTASAPSAARLAAQARGTANSATGSESRSGGRPGAKPRGGASGGPARAGAGGPRSPARSSRSPSGNRAPSGPVKLAPVPTRYYGIAPLNLSALLKQDLTSNTVRLAPNPTTSTSAAKLSPEDQLAHDLATRQEAQGDYSRYLPENVFLAPRGGQGQHGARARTLLTGNPTVGLVERNLIVSKVEQMMARK